MIYICLLEFKTSAFFIHLNKVIWGTALKVMLISREQIEKEEYYGSFVLFYFNSTRDNSKLGIREFGAWTLMTKTYAPEN